MNVDFQRPFTPPDGARELFLVRHGSVHHTVDGPPLGRQNDPPLNEHGRVQAAAVAVRLADEPIAKVFVSSLRRTAETAAPLLAARATRAHELADLREVELGDWEHGELARRAGRGDPEFERVMREQRWDLIPNAEPADAFAERVARGIDHAADAAGAGSIAVAFTHSAVIAESCRQATHSEPFAFMANSNASITRLVRLSDGRWVLVAFNETAHLPREWQPGGARGAGR
jgi:2,3-bisphosphoglycerate-dependent phosphoglycerate mutase